MRTWLLISIVMAMGTGCSAIRATSTPTAADVPHVDAAVCMSRNELSRKLRGVDERIHIPGGGQIDVYDMQIRPESDNLGRAWIVSVASLGTIDMAASIVNTVQECTEDTYHSGGLALKCDYKQLRFFAHYATENSDRPACVEMREVWTPANWPAVSDESNCMSSYRTLLDEAIDTSELPRAPGGWVDQDRLAEATVQELLQFGEDNSWLHGCTD